MNVAEHYDLIIVGGGLVGASLALALTGRGLRLALVEAAEPGVTSPPSYDDRGIALAFGSSRIFAAVGVWSQLADLAEPIRAIHVSDRGHFGFARISATEERVPALGYVLTGRDLGVTLMAAVQALDDVDLIAPARVVGMACNDRAASLDIDLAGVRRPLSAALVVAADGGKSFIRETLALPVRRWEYGQHAIVANITPERDANGVAYERFTDTGPVALLPLRDGHCAVVWTVQDEHLDDVLSYDDATFIAAFQHRFGYRLGKFVRVGQRGAYPLTFLRTLKSVQDRVAVIGNAAHTLHPVAGQGFNLGVRDVAALAEVIATAQRAGQDIGAASTLAHYQRWRSREQQVVSLATDGLVRLFSNPLGPLRAARNLGMLALDALPFSKHLLARAAMGTSGRLPRLARGLSLD